MEILGHQKQWDFLKKVTERGKFGHAYLFTGQEHLGKKTVALEWASLLFGKPFTSINGGGQNPDLILIEPSEKEIQINQIRDLIWKLSLKPYSAPLKVAIIDKAHLMNQEAQNCFLKTLEEPKDKTLIILISEYPEYLFPTIISRVEILKFQPVKKEEIKNYLKKEGLSEKESEEISEVSLGKPGAALEFILDKEKLNLQKEKIKEIVKISNSPLAMRFQYVKNLTQKPQNLRENLDIWLSYFRNLLLSHVNQIKINNQLNSGQYSLLKLKNILKLIQKINFLISTTNINPRLALETLMLEI